MLLILKQTISHKKLLFGLTNYDTIYGGYKINFITDRSAKEKLNKGAISTTLNSGETQSSANSILKMWTSKIKTIGLYLYLSFSPLIVTGGGSIIRIWRARKKFYNLYLVITEKDYFPETILEFIQVGKCYLKKSLVTDIKY